MLSNFPSPRADDPENVVPWVLCFDLICSQCYVKVSFPHSLYLHLWFPSPQERDDWALGEVCTADCVRGRLGEDTRSVKKTQYQ